MNEIRLFALGVGLTIIVFGIALVMITLPEKSHWGEHSRCYYDNPNTECGKTRYCPTHLPNKSRCLELNGTWELETPEREAQEWIYWGD